MAGIAEFEGDAAVAEDFYAKLMTLCENIYHSEHVHVLDYRLSHAEQIMRQGRLDEAISLSEAIMGKCETTSEWRIRASCLQTVAECHRLSARYGKEFLDRQNSLDLHEKKVGPEHKETIDALEALADCYLNKSEPHKAKDLYIQIRNWREGNLDIDYTDTVRTIECLAICHGLTGHYTEAETATLDAIDRSGDKANPRLLNNLCLALHAQGKWQPLESWSKQACEMEKNPYMSNAYRHLIAALEKQGKMEQALEIRAQSLRVDGTQNSRDMRADSWLPVTPPVRDRRRFGRMIHPRTWSA